MSAALEIHDLNAWYGESHVLHGINLTVHPGEVVCLLGRNGAGRTTTLRAILGLVGQRTGSIQVNGQEVIDECLRNNEVMLIMSSHINCWELVPPRTTQTGVLIDVIYKPLSSPFFDKLMYTIRSRFNITPIPMKQTFREMVKKKGQPRIVGIISDQAAETPDLAYWTTFLNQDTAFFTGMERFARDYNYPVVFVVIKSKKNGKKKNIFFNHG